MSLQQDIEKALNDFGIALAEDLKESAIKALKDAGSKNVQEIALEFSPILKFNGSEITLQIISDKYWKAIEKGREKLAKKIPADVVGKEWQDLNGIDSRKIIAQMAARKHAAKNGIRLGSGDKLGKSIKLHKKVLDYDKASKTLSFIIQKSIYKKGIKPKPFRDRVVNDGRLKELEKTISEMVGKDIKANVI